MKVSRRSGVALRRAACAVAMIAVGGAASSSRAEPPGAITFTGRNLVATAEGTFHDWTITHVEIDRANPKKSFVEIEIDVASLDTGIGRRDRHLRSDDFFHVEKYPKATIRAHSPKPRRGNDPDGHPLYQVTLEIEIHGHKKTIETDVSVVSETPLSVRGEVILDRRDFRIGKAYKRINPMSIRNEVPVRFLATLALP